MRALHSIAAGLAVVAASAAVAVPRTRPVTAGARPRPVAVSLPRARAGAARRALREEARALWVPRTDYGSAADIAAIMRFASDIHLNIVYLQVRGASDAIYRSALDPCSPRLCGHLGGTPTWDPLEVAVREAHARGLQLHAWINVFAGWESDSEAVCGRLRPSDPGEPNHVLVDHPEWVMYTSDRKPQGCPNRDEYVWLSPGVDAVRTHVARVAADIVRRYDVDGVHLDRIRYPDTYFGWEPASLAAFGRDPAADPAGWAEFRRGLIDRTVREVYDSVSAVRRVTLSAAVWPIYDRTHLIDPRTGAHWSSSSGVTRGQDPWRWARDGYLDVAVPMTYFVLTDPPCEYLERPGREPNPDWRCMIRDQVAGLHQAGRHVYAGIASGWPYEEMERQISAGRELGVDGFSFYGYGTLTENGRGRRLAEGPFHDPAVVPHMPWRP